VESSAGQTEHLSFAEARARVRSLVPLLATRLRVADLPLLEALGRPLAAPFLAPEALPRFDNTAVDGYAVRAADAAEASPDRPVRLRVLERVPAGRTPRFPISSGESSLVMTGAPIPSGADAMVMREHTHEGEGEVRIRRPVAAGENIRPRGEDVAAAERLFEAGRVLRAGEIGVFAAFGLAAVAVRLPFRVAILSTGDELRIPGQSLGPGQIYDSNSYVIRALLPGAMAETGDVVRISDDARAVAIAIEELASRHDVVLSIGGVSAGDFDVVKQIAHGTDTLASWRVAMRPGGPQAFGTVGGTIFYGLPGNPVSAAVVFDRLLRPMMREAAGVEPVDRPMLRVRLDQRVGSAVGRREFPRVRYFALPATGEATLAGAQSSGCISSLARADGVALVPEELGEVPAGAEVDVLAWEDV
jgi:molybdopterin molybdotransferase